MLSAAGTRASKFTYKSWILFSLLKRQELIYLIRSCQTKSKCRQLFVYIFLPQFRKRFICSLGQAPNKMLMYTRVIDVLCFLQASIYKSNILCRRRLNKSRYTQQWVWDRCVLKTGCRGRGGIWFPNIFVHSFSLFLLFHYCSFLWVGGKRIRIQS